MERIFYQKGYKYLLTRRYTVKLGFKSPYPFSTRWFSFASDGTLTINSGYAWDGPSGPCPDFRWLMRPSLVHDTLYQAIRMGLLPPSFRRLADAKLEEMAIEDGAGQAEALIIFEAVDHFGANYARRGTEPKELTAP